MAQDRDPNHLDPVLQTYYAQLMEDLLLAQPNPIDSHMIEGWRDPAYQDELVAEHITKVCSALDKHCVVDANGNPASKAFDLGIFEGTGAYVSNGKDARYTLAGALWRKYAQEPDAPSGMRWGGDFVHAPPDYDHFEIG